MRLSTPAAHTLLILQFLQTFTQPLYMVCGKPIPVPKMAKDHPDFEATVDKIHAQVVEQLQELYDRHKASVGKLLAIW